VFLPLELVDREYGTPMQKNWGVQYAMHCAVPEGIAGHAPYITQYIRFATHRSAAATLQYCCFATESLHSIFVLYC